MKRINKGYFSIFFILITFTCFVTVCYSKVETFYQDYKYVMGDNDTKNDAKRLCFIEAKRMLIEKVGTYIESETEISNYRLSKDEVRTFAGAFVKTEILHEETKYEGQSVVIYMSIKADVNPTSVTDNIKRIKEDKKLEKKVKTQQDQISQLEKKIRTIQSKLSTSDIDRSYKLREERKEDFDKLDELENIKHEIKKKTTLAIENIDLGMTPNEVERIAGKPRSAAGSQYNYGKVWIIFEGGIVNCIIRGENYQGIYHTCSTYRSDTGADKGAIIK